MSSSLPQSSGWFRPLGWVYRPVHPFGWLATLGALAFTLHVGVALDRHAHSVSDTLYAVYPFAASTFLGLMWVASRSCDGGAGGGR